MKGKRKMARLLALLIMLTVVLSLIACSTKYKAVTQDKDSSKMVTDTNYTEDLKREEGVQSAQVYVQDGMAIATMVMSEKVSDSDVKLLAEKYASELKKTYKDMKVNVQAVKNGKNAANIVLD